MTFKIKKNKKGEYYIPQKAISKFYDIDNIAYYQFEVKDGVLHFTAYDDKEMIILPKVVATKKVTYMDVPSGWKFGWPKALPDPKPNDMKQWLIDNGYPKQDAEFALQHCRMWESEE